MRSSLARKISTLRISNGAILSLENLMKSIFKKKRRLPDFKLSFQMKNKVFLRIKNKSKRKIFSKF